MHIASWSEHPPAYLHSWSPRGFQPTTSPPVSSSPFNQSRQTWNVVNCCGPLAMLLSSIPQVKVRTGLIITILQPQWNSLDRRQGLPLGTFPNNLTWKTFPKIHQTLWNKESHRSISGTTKTDSCTFYYHWCSPIHGSEDSWHPMLSSWIPVPGGQGRIWSGGETLDIPQLHSRAVSLSGDTYLVQGRHHLGGEMLRFFTISCLIPSFIPLSYQDFLQWQQETREAFRYMVMSALFTHVGVNAWPTVMCQSSPLPNDPGPKKHAILK